mmetsp:Transcript_46683/g.143962  ORF Transcript_46683/g.143962 Transcript_46683/m.143962 type:complete len:286 (+) Transcript_46683:29-886(+)
MRHDGCGHGPTARDRVDRDGARAVSHPRLPGPSSYRFHDTGRRRAPRADYFFFELVRDTDVDLPRLTLELRLVVDELRRGDEPVALTMASKMSSLRAVEGYSTPFSAAYSFRRVMVHVSLGDSSAGFGDAASAAAGFGVLLCALAVRARERSWSFLAFGGTCSPWFVRYSLSSLTVSFFAALAELSVAANSASASEAGAGVVCSRLRFDWRAGVDAFSGDARCSAAGSSESLISLPAMKPTTACQVEPASGLASRLSSAAGSSLSSISAAPEKNSHSAAIACCLR